MEEGGGRGREEGMLKERQEELVVMTVDCVCVVAGLEVEVWE